MYTCGSLCFKASNVRTLELPYEYLDTIAIMKHKIKTNIYDTWYDYSETISFKNNSNNIWVTTSHVQHMHELRLDLNGNNMVKKQPNTQAIKGFAADTSPSRGREGSCFWRAHGQPPVSWLHSCGGRETCLPSSWLIGRPQSRPGRFRHWGMDWNGSTRCLAGGRAWLCGHL